MADSAVNVKSCRWFRNGEMLPGGETFIWSKGPKDTDKLEGGNYSFELILDDGSIIHSTVWPISTKVSATSANAYPNPLPKGTTMTVESDDTTGFIKLYNVNGKLLMQMKPTGTMTEVHLDQPAGLYFLKFNGKTIKITIQ